MYIEGRLRTRKWQDKTGNDRYTTEIVANDMQMLGGRSGGGGGMAESRDSRETGGGGADNFGYAQEARAPGGGGSDPGFQDDDIPF